MAETESRKNERLTRAFRILINFCAAMVVTSHVELIFETQLTQNARSSLEGMQRGVDASLAALSPGNLSDAFSAAWSSVHVEPLLRRFLNEYAAAYFDAAVHGFLHWGPARMGAGIVGVMAYAITHGGLFGVVGCLLGGAVTVGVARSLKENLSGSIAAIVVTFIGVCIGFGLVILLLHALQLLLAVLLSTAASIAVASRAAFSKTEHWADHRLAHFAASAILRGRPR